MTKYIDPHTILTAVIILALTALAIAKVDMPPWVLPLLATISPGVVFQKPAPDKPKDPPVVPPVVTSLALMAMACISAFIIALACSPAAVQQVKQSDAAHEVKDISGIAQQLCKLDPEMLAVAKEKGALIDDVCAGVEAVAPFVQTLLAAQKQTNADLAAKRMAAKAPPCPTASSKDTAP